MVCREIFGDCRCYAYKGEDEQFCAKRWGVNILPCSSDCCIGGCPDDGSRQPYRFIDRPEISFVNLDKRALFFIWLIITLVTIYFFTDLKITRVRKI